MMSHETVLLRNGKFIKYWDISQIHTRDDALKVGFGDFLVYKEVTLEVTYLSAGKKDSRRIWRGRIYGGKERWGLDDNTVVVWGPNGMAGSITDYEEGKFFDFVLKNKSYLWL